MHVNMGACWNVCTCSCITGVPLWNDLHGAPHAGLAASAGVLARHAGLHRQWYAPGPHHWPVSPFAARMPAARTQGHQGNTHLVTLCVCWWVCLCLSLLYILIIRGNINVKNISSQLVYFFYSNVKKSVLFCVECVWKKMNIQNYIYLFAWIIKCCSRCKSCLLNMKIIVK